MIEGVKIKKLITHSDDRGFFREILRSDDKMLDKFGQSSVTLTYPGVIKAFHWHKEQDDLWYVASGMVQTVLYDRRENSKTYRETQVIYMGEDNPVAVLIPQGVAHGYRVLGNKSALVFYQTTQAYNPKNPDEQRIPFDDPEINFNWETQNK
ncbi:MAG TPA: spore coat protein [Candidatus Portnoybacteria bacterium]|nr:spore coat protein [Candidatus Portnoybacteria bacterium]